MPQRYSYHKIDHADRIGFDPADYSRFKFGDDAIARRFGTELATGFISEVLSQEDPGQVVVIPSPYAFIPTATFAMKTYFVHVLNSWLAVSGYQVVQEAKVHRTVTYKEDYGELDAGERKRLIGNDSFHIDKAFVEGKTLVFLDDIRITGSHEWMIRKMIDTFGLNNRIYLLYYAELMNNQIHPRIENDLNYAAVKSIFDLEPIIRGRFAFNTRFVKYVLNTDPSVFAAFIGGQDEEFIETLYHLAVGNGYHAIDAYAGNLAFIRTHYLHNSKQTQIHGN
ncbi:MAG: hypothetical protein EOP49_00325 [Sphingobacteriales bacterium]|nr:MAG: hypothetical protein EOP49_00325 [Sphingobacteriales bacterium]